MNLVNEHPLLFVGCATSNPWSLIVAPEPLYNNFMTDREGRVCLFNQDGKVFWKFYPHLPPGNNVSHKPNSSQLDACEPKRT